MRCVSPVRVQHDGIFKDVPCGKCNFCIKNLRHAWSFRLQKQLAVSKTAYFVTLTYNEDNVPFNVDEDGCVELVLRKSDFQKYMKKVRKVSSMEMKYYAIGEYGDETQRPHYHALLFDFLGDSKVLKQKWEHGNVVVGTVTMDSIDYVTQYHLGRVYSEASVKPFSLISNGIGLDHFKLNKDLYENVDYVVSQRGYKLALPRYYRGKLSGISKATEEPVTRVSKDISYAKRREESELQRAREVARLARFHPDPDSHYEERIRAMYDKVRAKSKKGKPRI